MSINQQIASDSRVEIKANMDGGRLLIKMPVNLIDTHPRLSKIRGRTIDITRLKDSTKTTGGAAVYTPLLYAEAGAKGQPIRYFVADGHQRLQAAKDIGQKEIFAVVVLRWATVDQAYEEAISVQYARYEMNDDDLFSILRDGKVGTQQLVKMTGKSEATIERMRKVCDHQILTELIGEGAISINLAAKLIDACDKNETKVDALKETLTAERDKYQDLAKHYRNKYKIEGVPKDRKLADKQNLAFYFKGKDWSGYIEALASKEDDAIVDGRLNLSIETKAQAKAVIRIDDQENAWEDSIPIVFEGGNKHADMSVKNLQAFHDSLEMIGRNLEAIIARRRQDEIDKRHPIPAANPSKAVKPPTKPKKQKADMEIE